MIGLVIVATAGLLVTHACAQEGFVDHGVAAPAAESRGVVTMQDANGKPLVIALSLDCSPRGWILVTDIDSGETQQIKYPEGVPNSAPFASLMSENGRFYTFAGNTLLELDPGAREWLFHGIPAPTEECYTGSAMADSPEGLIYGGSYPNCHLVSFDPETKEMKDYGPMDSEEHYISYLVVDSTGWVYSGIGTARCNIVAFDPKSGERRQIVDEADRKLGTGVVYLGNDGKVYGRAGDKSYRMFGGNGETIAKEEAGPQKPTGAIGWGQTRGSFPDGRKLRAYALPDRWMEIEGPEAGEIKRLTFDYESEGASITSILAGPGGRIYGSSCHPMHFFAYDPEKDVLEDWGPVPRVGGGNFCAMAVQGTDLFGAAYAGGFFYRYDSTKPWNNETGDDPNPKLIAQFEGDITRPRACLAHPDGRHVMMAGFMGYGMRGGGLGIYDVQTEEPTLITHENLIPDQSTIALKALPNGDLVGGTSIQTPGGGHVTAKEGELYIMDWETRKVVFRTVPVPGAPEVWNVEIGPDGLVYGVASGSQFFVFDPEKREVVRRESLADYGNLPRHLTLLRGPEDMIYALFTKCIVRIEPGTFEHEKLADAPAGISAGGAIYNGRVYFAAGSHVWSYGLK